MFKSTYYSTNYILLAVSQASPGQPIKYFDLITHQIAPIGSSGDESGTLEILIGTPEAQDAAPMATELPSETNNPETNSPPLPSDPNTPNKGDIPPVPEPQY
tara:strand:+ start:2989 stop:3294 length:306 start_codon:yes stop_codon:yes gene_type:complete